MENMSGQGKLAVVPPEIDRWNWGAFLLTWIWGLVNNTFIALLMFVPFVNLVMPFILGAKGSAWAWQNKRWASVEEFRRIQRYWAIAGVLVLVLSIGAMVGVFFLVTGVMKHSGAYQMALSQVKQNTEVQALFGTPLSAGMLQGKIDVSGPNGKAAIAFPIQGPKASGTAYCEAEKRMGKWRILRLEVAVDGRPDRLVLIPDNADASPGLPADGQGIHI